MAQTPPQQMSQAEIKRQNMFGKLSQVFKTPMRNILSETEEAVMINCNSMINEMIAEQTIIDQKEFEIQRLTKLCKDNKIDITPPTPPDAAKKPNRAARRKAAKTTKKAAKK